MGAVGRTIALRTSRRGRRRVEAGTVRMPLGKAGRCNSLGKARRRHSPRPLVWTSASAFRKRATTRGMGSSFHLCMIPGRTRVRRLRGDLRQDGWKRRQNELERSRHHPRAEKDR